MEEQLAEQEESVLQSGDEYNYETINNHVQKDATSNISNESINIDNIEEQNQMVYEHIQYVQENGQGEKSP
ncbi:8468_t:CDS:2 [Gigaspora margarita]|uniref:8468_t:CDS:1 n=1 Tax=Gigaspora margarita TaxID=4874 RepID=A0ABN7VES6_GIGMA|nr:8468_t:CDS:2 [Gigaspora margarita]